MDKRFVAALVIGILLIPVLVIGHSSAYTDVLILSRELIKFRGDLNLNGNQLINASAVCLGGNCLTDWSNATMNITTNTYYGGLYNFSDGGVTIPIPASGSYYNITKLKCGYSDEFT